MTAWNLDGLDAAGRGALEKVLRRCDFNFDLLLPRLRAEKGKDSIPVEITDLTTYARQARTSVAPARHHNDHDHDAHSEPGEDPQFPDEGLGHIHMVDPETGDTAHGIAYRRRVLGLAWYSGKISLDVGLVSDPDFLGEVFMCEGAHMVDFFWMTDPQRRSILEAYGAVDWFEEGGEQDYEDWTGESFMIGFTRAFTDIVPRFDQFTHQTTPAVAAAIRSILNEGVVAPQPVPVPDPVPDPVPAPIPAPDAPFPGDSPVVEEPMEPPVDPPVLIYGFARENSKVYHLYTHWYIKPDAPRVVSFMSEAEAVGSGRRLCYFCKKKAHK